MDNQFATEEGRVYASGLNDWGQLGLLLSNSHSMVCIKPLGFAVANVISVTTKKRFKG